MVYHHLLDYEGRYNNDPRMHVEESMDLEESEPLTTETEKERGSDVILTCVDRPYCCSLGHIWSVSYVGVGVRQELAERWLARSTFDFGSNLPLVQSFLSS
jgi:hypothetical protein